MVEPGWSLGVDIGGTKVAAGLVDGGGRVSACEYADTPHRSTAPRDVEDVIVSVVRTVLRRAAAQGDDQLSPGEIPIGIGAAGFVDRERRTVRFSPHLSWRDEPLARHLQERLGRPVMIENDANAAAWAEYRFGAGRAESALVMITLGTGIGGGMVRDGLLDRGRHGMAGEFGHMSVTPGGHRCECGNRGCWEQYASGSALRREAIERLRAPGPHTAGLAAACGGIEAAMTGRMVIEAAAAGDAGAVEIVQEVGWWFGRGLANIAAALDPGTIVVGGGAGEAGDLLLDPARESLAQHLSGRGHRPVPVVRAAALGSDAGLIGAADLARSGPDA